MLRFIKHPMFIIFGMFLASYYIVGQYAEDYISDEPLILTKTPPEIVMYGTRNCKYCVIAKQFFKKHNLPYTEYDIEESSKHMNTFYMLGGRGTPLLIINRQLIHGYDERMIRDAL